VQTGPVGRGLQLPRLLNIFIEKNPNVIATTKETSVLRSVGLKFI